MVNENLITKAVEIECIFQRSSRSAVGESISNHRYCKSWKILEIFLNMEFQSKSRVITLIILGAIESTVIALTKSSSFRGIDWDPIDFGNQ